MDTSLRRTLVLMSVPKVSVLERVDCNDNDDNDGKTKPIMTIGVDDKDENDELW